MRGDVESRISVNCSNSIDCNGAYGLGNETEIWTWIEIADEEICSVVAETSSCHEILEVSVSTTVASAS